MVNGGLLKSSYCRGILFRGALASFGFPHSNSRNQHIGVTPQVSLQKPFGEYALVYPSSEVQSTLEFTIG